LEKQHTNNLLPFTTTFLLEIDAIWFDSIKSLSHQYLHGVFKLRATQNFSKNITHLFICINLTHVNPLFHISSSWNITVLFERYFLLIEHIRPSAGPNYQTWLEHWILNPIWIPLRGYHHYITPNDIQNICRISTKIARLVSQSCNNSRFTYIIIWTI
jgi:hypothetical protein